MHLTACLWLLAGALSVAAVSCPNGTDIIALQLKWVIQGQFIGFIVADGQSFYAQECLQVLVRPGGPTVNTVDEVVQNRAQIGITALPTIVQARDSGYNITAIAQHFQRAGMAEFVWKTSNITTIKDFKGKRAGVTNSYQNFAAAILAANMTFCFENGGAPNCTAFPDSDVRLVRQSLGVVPFLQRTIDAAGGMMYNEYALVLEEKNAATGKLWTSDEMTVFDFNLLGTAMLEDAIFATDAWLNSTTNRAIAVRFLRASFRGWMWARQNPEESVKLMGDRSYHQRWMVNEVLKLVWPSSDGVGTVPSSRVQATNQIMYNLGMARRLYTADEVSRSDLRTLAVQGMNSSEDVTGTNFTGEQLRFCLITGEVTLCQQERTLQLNWVVPTSISGIVLYITSSLLAATAMAILVLLFVYRGHPVIMKSSRRISNLIAVGGLLCAVSVIISIEATRSTWVCYGQVIFLALGFILLFGGLVVKTYRIYHIFSQTKMGFKVNLPDAILLLKFFLPLIAAELTLVVVHCLLSLGPVTSVEIDSLYYTQQCGAASSTVGLISLTLLFVFNVAIAFAGAVLGFRTRRVRSDYNESRYIFAAIYNTVVLAILFVPLVIVLSANAGLGALPAFIRGLGVSLGALTTLLILFVPKMLAILNQAKNPMDDSSGTHRGGGHTLSASNHPRGTQQDQMRTAVLKGYTDDADRWVIKPNASSQEMAKYRQQLDLLKQQLESADKQEQKSKSDVSDKAKGPPVV